MNTAALAPLIEEIAEAIAKRTAEKLAEIQKGKEEGYAYSEAEAAAYLHMSTGTLARLHHQGKGPRCFAPSSKSRRRYSRKDLDNFAEEKR